MNRMLIRLGACAIVLGVACGARIAAANDIHVGKAGENQMEDEHSRLRYIEVTNAQHFDAFIGSPVFAGYDTRFLPLHVYLIRALDIMYDHLKNGTPLPPSQVVRTVPRGGSPGAALSITSANVPPILTSPANSDRILFDHKTLFVPD